MVKSFFKKIGDSLKQEFKEANQMNNAILARKQAKQKEIAHTKQLEKNAKMLGKIAKERDGKVVPAYVLVGFLGSGKTTLLGRLIGWCLENNLTPGLIINEIGAAFIDADAVRQEGMEMTELSNGCICCTAEDDLQPALIQMASNPKVDLILLEASGLADPADMLDELTDPMLWETVEVGGIISVVDGSRFEELIEGNNLARRQAEYADVLMLNKCDMINREQREKLKKILVEITPNAQIFPGDNGLPYAGIEAVLAHSMELGRERQRMQAELRAKTQTKRSLNLTPTANGHPQDHDHDHHDHDHDHAEHGHSHMSIHVLDFMLDKPVDKAAFKAFLHALPKTIYRAKGFVTVQGEDDVYLFQHMSGYTLLSPFRRRPPVLRGVFIGQGMDENSLRQQLEATSV
jgi:G3E family GTPase